LLLDNYTDRIQVQGILPLDSYMDRIQLGGLAPEQLHGPNTGGVVLLETARAKYR
jgi:hypothetical protein